jgi:hypothetical protein
MLTKEKSFGIKENTTTDRYTTVSKFNPVIDKNAKN